jgi:hypothetical protein
VAKAALGVVMNSTMRSLSVAAAVFALSAGPSAASIIARTPTISGNGWVALGILGTFIGTIYMLIAGALHVERRDARLGRRPDSGEHGWFGFTRDDDEDPPDQGQGSGN